MENLDLLTTNKFVPTGVYSLSSDKKKEDYLRKQMEFRQYMEQKKSKFTMGADNFNNDLALDDLANTNAIDFKVSANPASEVKKTKSKTQNRPSSVSIDSRDRNTVEYKDANQYKIKLNRAFVNVSRIGLKSTEFPNTQQLIRGTPAEIANNIIAWQNEIDTTIITEFRIDERPFKYFDKSVELALDNGTEVILYNAPKTFEFFFFCMSPTPPPKKLFLKESL